MCYNQFMFASIKNQKTNKWKVAFIIFIVVYVALLLVKTDLGVTGSDSMLLRTLQAGKPLLLYSPNFPINWVKMGRFVPMVCMEYNILNLFSKSPAAFWYYFIHAVQYVLFMYLFAKIISKFTKSKFLIYMIPVLVSVTPGMILAWFQTMYLERDLIFFITIFIFFYLLYLERPKISYLVLGLISVNLFLYYKEAAFIPVGAFAFFHLIFSWMNSGKPAKNLNNDNPKEKLPDLSGKAIIFDALVLLSSIMFLAIYFFFVFLPYKGALSYNQIYSFSNLIKNILNYAFVVDPVVMFVVLPLAIWRVYKIFIKRDKPEVIYDSLLAAGTMYVFSFFVLNLFNVYYFAPVYIFFVPALIYFVPKIWDGKIVWKILVYVLGIIIIFNTLPSSLHWLTYSKYMPINLNKTLDFLVKDIKSKPDKRANLFLDGAERCGDKWVYFNFSEFLLYKGLTAKQFDLKSDQEKTPNCTTTIPVDIPLNQFTVFNGGPLPKIAKGDYLIVTPESTDSVRNNSDQAYLKSLENDYNLVFRTRSLLAFPMLDLKEILRYFLSIGASPNERFLGISRKQPNMLWPDYYVFVRK